MRFPLTLASKYGTIVAEWKRMLMSTIYIDGAVWEAEDKVVEYVEQLQSQFDKATEALKEKVIKCCRTCDSFDSKMLTVAFGKDGHCPFDSREHSFDDSCENWNIEALSEG